MVSAAQDRLQSSASTIANGVLVGVGAVTSALVTTVLTLVLAFFFLKDGRRFLPWVAATAGPTAGHHLTVVASRAWVTLGGFVRTQALVGLIDAVLIGLGLVVLGIPLALPLAVLTFVAAFAPIVGAIAVGAIAAEFRQPGADPSLMRQVALRSGGAVVGLDTLGAFVRGLREAGALEDRPLVREDATPLLGMWPLLLLALALLTVEWVWRKRIGMV